VSASVLALSEVNGQRFGRLVALQIAYTDRGSGRTAARIWTFRCDCGSEIEAPLFKATRGDITSCGCAEEEEMRRVLAVPGEPRLSLRAVVHRPEVVERQYESFVVSEAAKSVVGRWTEKGVFTSEQIFVIEEARLLWTLIGRPSHDFFDSDDPEDNREGLLAERAKCLLRNCRRLVGDRDWRIFENVVRWNEPLGFIGSRLVEGGTGGHACRTVADVAERVAEAGLLDETGFSRLVG
jgi:hypothetical protein